MKLRYSISGHREHPAIQSRALALYSYLCLVSQHMVYKEAH